MNSLIRKGDLKIALGLFSVAAITASSFFVFADSDSNFTIKINPGTLAVDLVDASNDYAPVDVSVYRFSEVSASTSCLSGVDAPQMTLGGNVQTLKDDPNTYGGNIYIQNPDASSDGFTVSLAATGGKDTWFVNGANVITYNGNDCDMGNFPLQEAYNFGGRMYVDPTSATIENARCSGSGCTTNGLSLGSSSSFEYDVIDSITLLQADASADNIADYVVNGINVSQTIPAMAPSGSYALDMTISVISNGNSDVTEPAPLRAEIRIRSNNQDIQGSDIYVAADDSVELVGTASNISWSIIDEGNVQGPPYLSNSTGISTFVYNDDGMNATNVKITATKPNEGPSLVSDVRIHFGTGYDCGLGVWKASSSECPPM